MPSPGTTGRSPAIGLRSGFAGPGDHGLVDQPVVQSQHDLPIRGVDRREHLPGPVQVVLGRANAPFTAVIRRRRPGERMRPNSSGRSPGATNQE